MNGFSGMAFLVELMGARALLGLWKDFDFSANAFQANILPNKMHCKLEPCKPICVHFSSVSCTS
jgi:hypothetical protein